MDCKIPVRKYVLIAQPASGGRQKGERVVVQSPACNTAGFSQVPVRHFHGQQQNSVFFVPKTDIERDSSNAYEKAQVSQEISPVNAHGVALFQSVPADKFHYRKGDKFWISTGPITDHYEDTVPVINLRTYQSGIILIDQVCWFPKVRGPGGELWTLGGPPRQLKLVGPKNIKTWSWVVCQHLDGTKSTTKDVEIPTKDVAMAGRSLLTTQESQALFEQRYQYMQECSVGIFVSPFTTSPTFLVGSLPPTPPTSPDVQHIQKAGTGTEKRKQAASHPQVPIPAFWQRVGAEALESRKRQRGPYVLRRSMIHTQNLSQFTQRGIAKAPTYPAAEDEDEEESDDDDHDDDDDDCGALSDIRSRIDRRCSSRSVSAAQDEQPIIKDLPGLDGDGLNGAYTLVDIRRNGDGPVISLTSPRTAADPAAAIRAYYEEHGLVHNPFQEALCDSNIPGCPYITKSTGKHYHPSHEKCRRRSSGLTPAGFDHLHPNVFPRLLTHEHCISRAGAFPDRIGDCLLANSPYRHPSHKCCIWTPKDLESIILPPDHGSEDRKSREARKKRSEIIDTSSRVRLEVQVHFNVEDDEVLDEGGMAVFVNDKIEEWAKASRLVEACHYEGKNVNWNMEFGLE